MVYGRKKQHKGSLVVMLCTLTLLFLYLANVAPVLRITLYWVSSVFIFGIMLERMPFTAILSFFIVGFLGFLIVPDKSGMLPYLFFFGHYGIFKYFADGGRGGAAAVARGAGRNVGGSGSGELCGIGQRWGCGQRP